MRNIKCLDDKTVRDLEIAKCQSDEYGRVIAECVQKLAAQIDALNFKTVNIKPYSSN